MIYDTSYTDKRIVRKINEAVGVPFGWKERWKMGGIGSKRMVIKDISEEYRAYLNADHYQTNANIELRPKGVLIHFRHKLQAYSWVMPFAGLEIKLNELLTLQSDHKFITLDPGNEHEFITKLMSQKEHFLALK